MKLDIYKIPPTKAQLNFIHIIEDFTNCPKFTGNSKFEATIYINRYKEIYELVITDKWALSYI